MKVYFEEIYKLFFKDVYYFMLSITESEDIAEEITQETFVKALKAIDSFDGKKDIRAWLFTIARNTYYTSYRKEKRFIKEEIKAEFPDSRIYFEQELINEEDAYQIHKFLHEMDEPYKEVFSLRVFGELPFERIANLFGKSESWARVTYHRAKKKILERWKEVE